MQYTATALSIPQNSVEYVIYAYLHEEEDMTSCKAWKRIKTGYDLTEMKQEAQALFKTKDYKKIEIQKKFLDKKTGQARVATCQVFEQKAQADYFIIISVLLLAMASAGVFYLQAM